MDGCPERQYAAVTAMPAVDLAFTAQGTLGVPVADFNDWLRIEHGVSGVLTSFNVPVDGTRFEVETAEGYWRIPMGYLHEWIKETVLPFGCSGLEAAFGRPRASQDIEADDALLVIEYAVATTDAAPAWLMPPAFLQREDVQQGAAIQ